MGDKINRRFKKLGPGLVAGLVDRAVAAITSQMGRRCAPRSRRIVDRGKDRRMVSVERFQELRFVATENRVEITRPGRTASKKLSLVLTNLSSPAVGSAAGRLQNAWLWRSRPVRKLDDPAALLAEIIDAINDLDKAAQNPRFQMKSWW